MQKFKLDIEYTYDFTLIGICCHEKDYRLCWAVNSNLGFELVKADDYEIKDKKREISLKYSLYIYENEYTQSEFYIIANRGNNVLLIPEQKEVDYFLLIKGNPTEKETLIKDIKNISMVLTAYEIDPNQLKSKQNLLF